MVNFKKYKVSIFMNFDNSLEKNKLKMSNKMNYLFKHKNKIFSNFMLLYSMFLMFCHYSDYIYKNELEYNTNFNLTYFLIMDCNVNLF